MSANSRHTKNTCACADVERCVVCYVRARKWKWEQENRERRQYTYRMFMERNAEDQAHKRMAKKAAKLAAQGLEYVPRRRASASGLSGRGGSHAKADRGGATPSL